jgi:hypothetical protein
MLDAAHAFYEQAAERGFQAKWKYTEFGKPSHRPFRELSAVLVMISNTNYLLPASMIDHFLLRPHGSISK